MKRSSSFMVSALLVFAMVTANHADIPQVISYQGKVTDTGGTPVADGTYDMRFRIYDAAGGPAVQWNSGFQSVDVTGGVFKVLLGESPQPAIVLDFDQDYWLEVTIGVDVQSPRQQLASVGYAYMASGIVPGTEMIDSRAGPIFKGTNYGTGAGLRGDSDQGPGVRGQSSATDGSGVYGEATATTGNTYGGRFESASTSGRGVYAEATATTGTTYGVYGGSASTEGMGVVGYAIATMGLTCGGKFESASDGGSGVYGIGVTGVYGGSASRGVYGEATAETGNTYGVRGESASTSGVGVRGRATATTGNHHRR